MANKEICVSISLGGNTLPVGRLWTHQGKGKETASFEYAKSWLEHPERFALEPSLNLGSGSFHTRQDTSLFGAFADSAPDRWGRILMRRAHSNLSKEKEQTSSTLFESDYLLGVCDEARQGALRFSLPPNDDLFLNQTDKNTIPPLIELPKILSATENFLENNDSWSDLKLLLAPGSSLGGARPKASVRGIDGSLCIAKFPARSDDCNTVTWEALALTLAKKAGITTPEWTLKVIADKPILLLKRFDRNNQQRIPFLSAMSMLSAKDNEQHSYLEMAYALNQYGASPKQDLAALWRRIIFSIMINNTDDHLRNHGFLYEPKKGWRLSPAYDLNPTPTHIKARVLTTAIDFEHTEASLDLALSVAGEFQLKQTEAMDIIQSVSYATQSWKKEASRLGLNKNECDWMASAFEISNSDLS